MEEATDVFSLSHILAKLPTVALVIAIAVLLHLLVRRAVSVTSGRPPVLATAAPIARIVKWTITSIAGVLILFVVGIDLYDVGTTLATVFSLIAIGFVAMWSILSHMLACLLILAFRPFTVGDWIEVVGEDSVKGHVTDLNLVYTIITGEDGTSLQVPNNYFFQKVLRKRVAAASK